MAVRVRFAPSPTGFLHLGGLRTALYNYLFAKQKKGKFLLRIEDTDRKRLVPEAARLLEETLVSLGLQPDESPGNGGNFGPYFQSQRLPIYKSNLETLLKTGDAYPCFCSESRLDLLRKDAIRRREVPKYDNRCRSLSKQRVEDKVRQGVPHCFRFKLRSSDLAFTDLVYGKYSYDPAANEGDPVVMKEDGYPTYHFANVVDDHFMEISHVLRGDEWLVSTPKHLLMYKALGWSPPEYAHLPLILNSDGTKLSKRQDDLRVESLLRRGFYPLSIVNFITKIGGGFDENIQDLVPLDDLVAKFNLSRLNSHSCQLDTERLNDMNTQEIRRRLSSNTETDNLTNELRDKLQCVMPIRYPDTALQDRVTSDSYIRRVLNWASSASRFVLLDDLLGPGFDYLWFPQSEKNSKLLVGTGISGDHLRKIIIVFVSVPTENFSRNEISSALKSFATVEGLKFPVLMKVLRSCVSNLKEGPSVGEMMEVLGKEETISRLEVSLAFLS